MRTLCAAIALALAPGLGLAGPDLSGTIPIIDEGFEGPLNRYDGAPACGRPCRGGAT